MAQLQMREALRQALAEEMRRDSTVLLMGEEVAEYNGAYKVSEGLLAEFGADRVVDTPIAELGFASIAVGAAMAGVRPVVEFMTFNFALLAIDQVVNHAAKVVSMSNGQFHCPIVFRGPTGAAGQLAQQHSQSFENWYANVPGLKVVSVCNPADAKGLLKSAIRDNDPVVFMESEQLYGFKGEVPDDEDFIIPIGKARIARTGSHVTIISFGKIMQQAEKACEELAKEGIEAELIDLRTLRPIDYDTVLESVRKTNRCVIIEEAWPLASISSELGYIIQKRAFDYLDAPVTRITTTDTPLPYAPQYVEAFMPNPAKIIRAVKEVLYLA
jgi:pyruvate dehydrogenase E1 component beta subunit